MASDARLSEGRVTSPRPLCLSSLFFFLFFLSCSHRRSLSKALHFGVRGWGNTINTVRSTRQTWTTEDRRILVVVSAVSKSPVRIHLFVICHRRTSDGAVPAEEGLDVSFLWYSVSQPFLPWQHFRRTQPTDCFMFLKDASLPHTSQRGSRLQCWIQWKWVVCSSGNLMKSEHVCIMIRPVREWQTPSSRLVFLRRETVSFQVSHLHSDQSNFLIFFFYFLLYYWSWGTNNDWHWNKWLY